MLQNISPLPAPPTRNDPQNFSERADSFLLALQAFSVELNSLISSLNSFSLITSDSYNNILSLHEQTEQFMIQTSMYAASAAVKANFKGEYNNSAMYNKSDIVSYQGVLYISIIDNNTASPANSQNWTPFTNMKYVHFQNEQSSEWVIENRLNSFFVAVFLYGIDLSDNFYNLSNNIYCGQIYCGQLSDSFGVYSYTPISDIRYRVDKSTIRVLLPSPKKGIAIII